MRLKLISMVQALRGKQIKKQLVTVAMNIFVQKKQNLAKNVKKNVYLDASFARHITTQSNIQTNTQNNIHNLSQFT